MSHARRLLGGVVMATAAVLVAACSVPDATSPPMAVRVEAASPYINGIPFVPEPEEFEICKTYLPGVAGPPVTFAWSVYHTDDGQIDNGSTTLSGGECAVVAIGGALNHDHLVTVTENVPAGFIATHYELEYDQGVITQYPVQIDRVTTGAMHGDRGWTAIYLNRGAQGCSHGYWKVDQHFDSWPAPYTSLTFFSDVFDDAFLGMTLSEVLRLQGGGLNALGREAVAALLNAGSGFYWYGTAEVINMFNARYPGTKSEYSALKDDFEAKNITGCPLN